MTPAELKQMIKEIVVEVDDNVLASTEATIELPEDYNLEDE